MYRQEDRTVFQHTSQPGISLELYGHQHVAMQDSSKKVIIEPLSTSTLSIHDFSESSRSTRSSLAGLHNHWMSTQQQHVYMSIIFFAIGFSAIAALAMAIIGWLSLDIAAYVLVWPSLVTWCVLGILYPDYGKLALKGFVIGILACIFYDSMRFVAIAFGLWGDFIPRIGMWLLHTNKPDWVVGYIWRYVGDGGFMSTAFVMGYRLLKPKLDVRAAALAFGIAIWLCLVGTILLAPHGAEMLFPLTPITVSLSLLGHIIYGLSIGFLYSVFVDEKTFSSSLKKKRPWYAKLVAAKKRVVLLEEQLCEMLEQLVNTQKQVYALQARVQELEKPKTLSATFVKAEGVKLQNRRRKMRK